MHVHVHVPELMCKTTKICMRSWRNASFPGYTLIFFLVGNLFVKSNVRKRICYVMPLCCLFADVSVSWGFACRLYKQYDRGTCTLGYSQLCWCSTCQTAVGPGSTCSFSVFRVTAPPSSCVSTASYAIEEYFPENTAVRMNTSTCINMTKRITIQYCKQNWHQQEIGRKCQTSQLQTIFTYQLWTLRCLFSSSVLAN